MDAWDQLRTTALSMIARDIPYAFWTELNLRVPIVYVDTFSEVAADSKVLIDQKIDDLLQRRHFRMEKLLIELAARHKLAHSMNIIIQNRRRHAYVFQGEVAITQSYVQAIGSLPQPAKFRERFARKMGLPRLDLGDEPDGAFLIRSLYGLVAHNPVGRRFHSSDQRLGTLQFCLPSLDCKAWAFQLPIPEIMAAYPAIPKKAPSKRQMRWKKRPGDEGTGTDGPK